MTNKDINTIWKKFHNSLLFFIQKRVKKSEDANDILQEVFVKIAQSDIDLKSFDKLTSWIYTITRNTIIDYWRSNKTTLENVSALEFDPAEHIEKSNQKEINTLTGCVKKMIGHLPEKYAVVFNMYETDKLTHQQIAQKLDISVSGSKTRLQRAREKLKELLISCCKVETDAYGNILNSCADHEGCNNCEDLEN